MSTIYINWVVIALEALHRFSHTLAFVFQCLMGNKHKQNQEAYKIRTEFKEGGLEAHEMYHGDCKYMKTYTIFDECHMCLCVERPESPQGKNTKQLKVNLPPQVAAALFARSHDFDLLAVLKCHVLMGSAVNQPDCSQLCEESWFPCGGGSEEQESLTSLAVDQTLGVQAVQVLMVM